MAALGELLGGPWAPTGDQKRAKIASKSDVDFGMPFGSENGGKWLPPGSKNDRKTKKK